MFTTRSALATLLACVLLAIPAPAVTAGPSPEESYLNSYGTPPAAGAGTAAAEAQEDYYGSYGAPAPVGDSSDGMPWLPIALVSITVIAIAGAAAGATQRRRRLRAARAVAV